MQAGGESDAGIFSVRYVCLDSGLWEGSSSVATISVLEYD